MMSLEVVRAQRSDGAIIEFQLQVSDRDPWRIEYCESDGTIRCFEETDLYRALQNMRRELEREGVMLLCAGARPNVFPSGMSRSMGGGRKAYIMPLGSPANRPDLIDIFEYADRDLVGTVEEQAEYYRLWNNSLVQPHPGEIQEAKKHPNGWVYRIAGSFGPNDGVPPEAIVGAWKVDESGVIVGDFIRNPKYDPIKWPNRSVPRQNSIRAH